MNSIRHRCATAWVLSVTACFTIALAQGAVAAEPRGAALVGGALPGGAVLSSAVQGAKLVTLTPAGGGATATAELGPDGSFGFEGLTPGRYQLALHSRSTPKQTQAQSFGERDAAVGSVSNARPGGLGGGASAAAYAKVNINPNGMPNRISMNVTVARRMLVAEVDGTAVAVEVGADGRLSGLAQAAMAAASDAAPEK